MVSPSHVIDRIASGYYNDAGTTTMHRDFCSVLDVAIECFTDEGIPVTSSPDACSNLWLVDRCLNSSKRNETVRQECLSSRLQQSESSREYLEMHCNSSSGFWNRQKSCYTDGNQIEATPNTSFINHTQGYSDFEEVEDYDIDQDSKSNLLLEMKQIEIVKRFVTIGHVISLISLVIAITMLVLLKRLHCTRIYIHINLMVTFILRGLLWILHATAFENTESAENDMAMVTLYLGKNIFKQYNASFMPNFLKWKQEWCESYQKTNYVVPCRLYFVVLSYTVTANYYWLLVEGLYLALLLRARNPNRNHKIFMRMFLILGWALPWLSVIGGTIAKLVASSRPDSCWFEDSPDACWWIINAPIIITLLINFIIFIVVIKVVGSKLRGNRRHSQYQDSEDYKWRLTKSTLALIPLLGIQYLLTVFIVHIENPTWSLIKKAFELVFVSIQGFLVAFIYCFLNGEIKEEFKRCWRSWKMDWELKVRSTRRRTASSHTSFTNLYSNYSSRKTSAASATSAKRKDSVFVAVKSNDEISPKLWRHAPMDFEFSEQSIAVERQNRQSDSSTLTNGGVARPSDSQKSSNFLVVPLWNNTLNNSTSESSTHNFPEEHVHNEESVGLIPNLNEVARSWKNYKTTIV